MRQRFPFLNALRAFEATHRCGSLSEAAKELSVTVGAVSRQIAQLEKELGARLFIRHPRGVEPTAQGRALARTVTDAFDRIDATTDEIRHDKVVNRLTVFSHTTLAVEWLVPRIGSFQRAHPGIELNLFASVEPTSIYDGSADVGLWAGAEPLPGTHMETLFQPEYFPVCSPKLPGEADTLRPSDLQRFELLYSVFQVPHWQAWLQAAGVGGVALDNPRFTTSAQAYRAAQDGHGMFLAQRMFVSNDIAAGTLVAPFRLAIRHPAAYRVVCLEPRKGEPSIQAFRHWLEQELREADRIAQAAMPSGMEIVPVAANRI
jgi:LysR family glycine cleavage system transcriptional activator